MAEKRSYNYEGMFLISQSVAVDFGGAIKHIEEVLARGHATVLAMKKWDERRLAYEIKGQKRGVYILAYFKAPGPDIAHIERDCNLSEKILRAQILRCDHLTEENIKELDGRKELEIEAKMRAERPQVAPAAAPAAEAAPATA